MSKFAFYVNEHVIHKYPPKCMIHVPYHNIGVKAESFARKELQKYLDANWNKCLICFPLTDEGVADAVA